MNLLSEVSTLHVNSLHDDASIAYHSESIDLGGGSPETASLGFDERERRSSCVLGAATRPSEYAGVALAMAGARYLPP